MKTAVLTDTNCLNDSCFDNANLEEISDLRFMKINIDEACEDYTHYIKSENTINEVPKIKSNISSTAYSYNSVLSHKLAKVLSVIPYLYSLRCYFKKKINIYFCNKCMTYFRRVILLHELRVCNNCINHFQISDFFSILYSIIYPFEPKAFIMGCLCTGPVLKQRQYIQCGCIFFYKDVDHENILKTVFKFEKRLWNKLLYVSSLTCTLKENIISILKKINKMKCIKILPMLSSQNVILNPETKGLQVLFRKLYTSLCGLLSKNAYLGIGQNATKHLRGFISICNSRKLILSKFRAFFRDFESFFERSLDNYSPKDYYKFREMKRKQKLSCDDYPDFLLLFGFYIYFLEIMIFSKENSISISNILLIFMSNHRKRNMMYILLQMCNYHYYDLFKIKESSLFKSDTQDIDLKQNCINVNKLGCPHSDNDGINNVFIVHELDEENNQIQTVEENMECQSSTTGKMTVNYKCCGSNDHLIKHLEKCIFIGNQFKETISSNSTLVNNSKDIYPIGNTITTGKEELDVIDGVNIYSFETEPDMAEFTMIQVNQRLLQSDSNILGCTNRTSSGRIIPTKTRDITKIKGWRNKLFCTDKNGKHPINYLKNTYVTPSGCIEGNDTKCMFHEIKEEPLYEEFQIKEELIEGNNEVKSEEKFEMVEVKDEPLGVFNDHIDNKNGFIKPMNNLDPLYIQVLSEDKIFQGLSKQLESVEGNQGIFQSSVLDEYLRNNSKLKVNFDLSECYNSSPSFHNKKTKSLLPIDMYKPKSSHLKDKQLENKAVDFSSTDFIHNILGDISMRKYFWVRSRPILIEHENRKIISNSSSKKRHFVHLDSAFGVLTDNGKDENYSKKKKITKQLDDSKVLVSDNNCFPLNYENQVKNKKPYLSLLNTFKIDEMDEERGIHFESSVTQKFPLIFPCTSFVDSHSECAKFSNIQLGMVINIGNGRPFLEEVLNNVEQLKKDENIVDRMWANIAASAVCSKRSSRRVKRYIVPVVSDSLIEVVKFSIENFSINTLKINELNIHSVYRSLCALDVCTDTTRVEESEIKEVLEDIIDYVVKRDQYELLTIPYDPDIPNPSSNSKLPVKKPKKSKVERELKRLINVTLVDDWHGTDETNNSKDSCGNEHCLKGCICNSLNGKLTVLHCGKLECMFQCSCDNKINYSVNNFIHNRNRVVLAKEESRWHQTVICKNNEVIEIKAETGKCKREKKLPTRFRNNVLLGKEMSSLDPPSPSSFLNSKNFNSFNKLPLTTKVMYLKTKEKNFKIREKDNKEIKNKDNEFKNKEKDFKGKHFKEKDSKEEDSKEKDFNEEDSKGNDVKEKESKEKDSKEKEKNSKIKDTDENKHVPKTSFRRARSKLKTIIPAHLKQFLSKADMKKMANIFYEGSNHPLTLADVFVWCAIHRCYSCSCSGQVFILKNNKLVWKPSIMKTHLTVKCMSQIVIDNSMQKYQAYDQNCYSARTYGSIFNYKLRNSSPIFKCKRLNEILNFVLSNTNSFVKVDFPALELPLKSIKQESKNIYINEMQKKEININKMSHGINNHEIINKRQNLSSTVENNVASYSKKRKRSTLALEEIKVSNKEGSVTYVTEPIKEDSIIKMKKKYRIGPAHFEWMVRQRTILTHIPSNNVVEHKANDNPVCNSTNNETVSSLNENDATKDIVGKLLPKYGLLCLTQGFGYLPVKEFTQENLQVQDPLNENVFHCFKDIDLANRWLNRFFKNYIVFESYDVNLKWVIVKTGILKYSQPFDKSLLENSSKIINKDGILIEKINSNVDSFQLHSEKSISKGLRVHDQTVTKRTLPEANKINLEGEELLPKKMKISFGAPREEVGVYLNDRLMKIYPIKKAPGCSQGMITEETSCSITTEKPSTNNNHSFSSSSTFFRLNNKPDFKVSKGCFVPLVPTKASNEHFKSQNYNASNCSVTGSNLISNVFNSNSNISRTLAIRPIKFNTNIKNVIIRNRGKTVPHNIKALCGRSILKTKFK